MTNIQKAFCVVLSLIFLCVVAALPGDFFKHGEIYRQLPLYCFLEKKALQEENGQDRETEMLLQEKKCRASGGGSGSGKPERAGGASSGGGGVGRGKRIDGVRTEAF